MQIRKYSDAERLIVYLRSFFRQVKGDPLADFRRELAQDISLKTADHDLTQLLVELV